MKLKLLNTMLATAAVLVSAAAASAAEKITLMYTATAPFVSAFVAKDQGFFEKHGLDVDMKLTQNGSVIVTGLVSGSAQVGIPTPVATGRLLEWLVAGTQSTEPLMFAAIVAGILLCGLMAGFLPARRAARVDPVVALRAE